MSASISRSRRSTWRTPSSSTAGWMCPRFLRKVGYVLSMSDAKQPESFHVTPFEGLASRAMALALPWEGIEYLYPQACVVEDGGPHGRAHPLLSGSSAAASGRYRGMPGLCGRENYDIEVIWQTISRLLRHGGNDEEVAH